MPETVKGGLFEIFNIHSVAKYQKLKGDPLGEREREREVNFPITAGWTPNKQFCFSKSAPFRILSPHSKLWYHICSQWSSNGGLEAVVSK